MATSPASFGVLQNTIAYTDNGTAVTIGYLPANAYIVDIRVQVSAAFNGNATNTVDIGVTGTAAKFADDVSLASVANASVTLLGSGVVQSTTSATKIIATVTSTASASTGLARITVKYVQL